MQNIVMGHLVSRLEHLVNEVSYANTLVYYDRLRALKMFLEETPVFINALQQLPTIRFDFDVDWRQLPAYWPPGREGYGMRWDALQQLADGGPDAVFRAWDQFRVNSESEGHRMITDSYVVPLYGYLLDQTQAFSNMLHMLVRYKRQVEWFEKDHLRQSYLNGGGEGSLDRDLRRFLFESGVDYPFSQPDSPGGRADIVAALETNDPLVLEAKVWDSEKLYGVDRIRAGLRQVMDYADKYGKDKGYVVVFNLDREPFVFVGQEGAENWPARLEYGGKMYFFIAVELAEQPEPVSRRDRSHRVRVNEVALIGLLDNQ